MKKSKLLKDSDSALKCIEAKAGCKSQPVDEETKEKIRRAAEIANERIKHNQNIYDQSYFEDMGMRYYSGGSPIKRRTLHR